MHRGLVLAVVLAAGSAVAQPGPSAEEVARHLEKTCALSTVGCLAGDTVLTIPFGKNAGPGCATQAIKAYVDFEAFSGRDRSPEQAVVVDRLRRRAGVADLDAALRSCHPVPAGQRARIVEVGEPKSGAVRIVPLVGGEPYWVTTFDVSATAAQGGAR